MYAGSMYAYIMPMWNFIIGHLHNATVYTHIYTYIHRVHTYMYHTYIYPYMQANREAIASLLFQHFNVPALYIANTSALALFASGKVTGVVVDCGLRDYI